MKIANEKNTDIQILRAIAILLVIAQHIRSRLPTPQAYHEIFNHVMFWPGVDIFFAISGFLICKTFYRDISTSLSKSDAIRSFWRRRAARLLPAVIFWAIASVAISTFTESYPNTDPLLVAKSAASGILGVSNIYWASCVQFSLQCGSADYNAVTWSLSLEWQLYAISTLIFSVAGFKRGILILAAISVLFSILPAPSFSFPWVFRPQAFVIGVAIYFATRNISIQLKTPTNLLILIAGISICILSPLNVTHPYMIPFISLGAGLCLISTLSGQSISAIPSKILEWVGERSYSIYLCHLPMILISRELLIRLNLLTPSYANFILGLAIALSLIVISAEISYKLIEVPFQRKLSKRKLTLKSHSTV
ncbi:acyltransferase family protein [Pseudomonas sp. BF-B-26]|uniref:acyltransferase family protein n=1 Tax=Pseudomonas sp. BF-B-26 TaxID=2832400 RepID=UPI001CBBDDFA|nr:acyltransferase [Pseudomonas sp. BF-B-26]